MRRIDAGPGAAWLQASRRPQWRRTLRACLSLFRIRVVESFQYRLAALSGVVTSFVWAIIEVAVFMVFYRYAENAAFAGGLTLQQAISHVWVRELLLFMMPYGIDEELRQKINSGDVALELCRPLDPYWHWLARGSASKIVMCVMRGLVCFGLGFLVPWGYGTRLPVSLGAFLCFIPSLLCAFLLCSAYQMLVTTMRLNVAWGDGPMYFMLLMAQILSGVFLPLQLWPDFMQPFLLVQPFAGIVDIPARLYVGSMAVADAGVSMAVQLVWTAVFILLGRMLMRRRIRSLVAQGG